MKIRPRKSAAVPPDEKLLPEIEQHCGAIEWRSIDQIAPYAGNPRKHPDNQIVQLMASLSHFGWTMPLLIDGQGIIIAGHARLEAAKRLGAKRVPVLCATLWSAAKIKAYRLADNKLGAASSWDDKLLKIELLGLIELNEAPIELTGFGTGEIDVLLSNGPEDDLEGDELPPMPTRAVARVGDLWCMGKHRLLCGSSLDPEAWVTLMCGQIAAMMLCDPPYNVKVNGHVSGSKRFAEFAMASGEMSADEFIRFNVDYLTAALAHLKDGAIAMVFMDHKHLYELMTAARALKLHHHNLCVWKKTNAGMGSLYRSQHELVLVLKHGKAPHTNNVALGKYGRWRSNVWECAGANAFGSTRDADLAAHPTVKPRELLAEAIRDVTHVGEIVVDAFSGSGSTILACEQAKRVGYAIEIEPGYVDVAIRRWEAMTGGRATLEATGQTFAEVEQARLSASGADLSAAA